jgi:hypothetical protein
MSTLCSGNSRFHTIRAITSNCFNSAWLLRSILDEQPIEQPIEQREPRFSRDSSQVEQNNLVGMRVMHFGFAIDSFKFAKLDLLP